jgi:signal transduction histidine kinase
MLRTSLPPVKFLIVDDREENLFAIEQVLRRDGLELVMAQSARVALEALLVNDFALAIIDVQMPEMDGVELAEIMRAAERTQHVPIILVTASADARSHPFRGYEAGAVDFLNKPLEPVMLRNKAQTFLELYRQRQQLASQLELLGEAERKLAETLRLNETFVAAVAHDLRNPLEAVTTGASLIARRTSDPELLKLAQTISHSARRMARMTGALFDLTRARLDGGIPILCAPLDLEPLAQRVFQEQKLATPAREISLHSEGKLEGAWDATRIEQLLSNLLGNAVHHGAPSVPVELELSGRLAESVVLEVRNGGVIPEEVRPRLFDAFRGGKRPTGSDGLGLGLFIVQQIALAHGGEVQVQSDAATGTVFRVRLPRERGAERQ